MRLTIFHLDGERTLRGGERQILYLAAYLRKAGHSNRIVCRKGAPLDREARRLGFKTLHLPFLWEWDPLSAWRLRREIETEKKQGNSPLLHSHTSHTAALACLATLAVKGGSVPWIAHRRVDFALSGSLSARTKYNRARKIIAVSGEVEKILAGCGVSPQRVIALHDCFPLGSEELDMAGLERGWGPFPSENRISERRSLSLEMGIPAAGFWIGNLAALVPHKDHSTLISAFPKVLTHIPEARLLIAGEGPLKDSLKSQVGNLGLEARVHFLGYLEKPLPLLKTLDLFALSSWGEGMGSVLLEAMAVGIPIVATEAGGIPEVLENRTNALLVPPRDPEKLSLAIVEVLKDGGLAANLVQKARKTLEAFSLRQYGSRMEQIYAQAQLNHNHSE